MIHSSASITASIVKVNPYIRTAPAQLGQASNSVKSNKSLHSHTHMSFYYLQWRLIICAHSLPMQCYSMLYIYVFVQIYFVVME